MPGKLPERRSSLLHADGRQVKKRAVAVAKRRKQSKRAAVAAESQSRSLRKAAVAVENRRIPMIQVLWMLFRYNPAEEHNRP